MEPLKFIKSIFILKDKVKTLPLCFLCCATLLTFNASTHTELFPRLIIGVMVLGVMQHKIPIALLPVSCGTVYILAGTSTQRLDTHYKAISCMSETLSC